MKKNMFWKMFLAGLVLSTGCVSETEIDNNHPLDEEFGFINNGGKADNNVVPNSREAQAVLSFLNVELADDDAADDFEALLSTELHRYASKNLADERRGPDGITGTSDDREFLSLRHVDTIRYVGRIAIKRILTLAEENGHLKTVQDCGEVLGDQNLPRATIESQADLILIEDSGCTFFTQDLLIMIDSEIEPKYRDLHALDAIERIDGDLRIGRYLRGELSTGWHPQLENASFKGLKEVGGLLESTIHVTYPALEKVERFEYNPRYLNQVPSLVEVGALIIESPGTIVYGKYPYVVHEFQKLERVRSISAHKYMVVKASFPLIKTMKEVSLTVSEYPFPVLEEVSGNFNLHFIEKEHGDFIGYDTEKKSRPSVLRHVGGNVGVDLAVSDFSSLKTIAGKLTISCDSSSENKTLLNLEEAQSVSLSISGDCQFEGANKITLLDRDLNISVSEGVTLNTFKNLTYVGGTLSYQSDRTITGLNNLEEVDGDLELLGHQADPYSDSGNIDGLNKLSAVGGDWITLPWQLRRPQVDSFLEQITHFFGEVRFD